MTYICEKELRRRGKEFLSSLEIAGIKGTVIEDSFRDYSVKVGIYRNGTFYGNAILYYSPKKDLFTFKTHEMKDKSIVPELEECWYGKAKAAEKKDLRGYHIYVDGSYFNGVTGYGVVILKDGKVEKEFCGSVSEEETCGTHQVAGELFATGKAIKWCEENGIDEIHLFYDYEGIEKWATEVWQAKQPLTQRYRKFMRNCDIKIFWHKVDSHTGDRWNDRADELAKMGAGKT